MQTIPRIILDRLGLKLPANVKGLLNVRQMDVYDIIQLLVNTVNSVVKTNDGNIDKEEAFLAALQDNLNKWADQQEASIEAIKNSVINYIQTGELSTDGFITSSAAFSADFWRNIAASLLDKGDILAPGAEGNEYSRGGEVEPGSCWVLRLKMWGGGYNYVELTDILTNIQLEVNNTDGAVLTDNNKDFEQIGTIPFATKELGGLMHMADKKKLDDIYVGMVPSGQPALYIDGRVFVLQEYVKPATEYTYLEVNIFEFSYDEIDSNGGTVRPYVEVHQWVKFGTGVAKQVDVVATYQYNEETGKMETIYTNSDYMLEGGELELEFVVNNSLPSNVIVGKDGVVTKTSASSQTESVEVANITVRAKMNGVELAAESTASVYQGGAGIGKYTNTIASNAITTETFFDVSKSAGVVVNPNSIASDADWFTITRAEVSDRYVRVYYKVSENNGTSNRTANVTAMTSLGTSPIIIATITQAATSQSITSTVTDNIGAGESDFRDIVLKKTAGVTLDPDVDVHTDATWITITAVDVENEKVTITYTADANPNTSSRQATIVVDTNLGEASCVITIAQAAKALITVTPSSLSYNGTAGGSAIGKTLTVKGQNLTGAISVELKNAASAFSVSASSISKAVAERSSGGTLTVTWTPPVNAGTTTGTLVLKAANADDVEVPLSGIASGAVVAQTGYYGATSAAPSTAADVEAGTAIELTGSNSVELTGASHLWVAVPKDGNAQVSCKDNNDRNIVLTETTVGDWKVYDWRMPGINTNTAHFTIVI